MTGIEIALLIAGLIVFAASFIFSASSEKKESEKVLVILSNKQKDDIKNQILTVFDEQMAELKERTEIELDKMSAGKMNEMNEYSETILGEINRNHNEVMFLYDMLNEKKKEINNTVRDLNIVKKELEAESAKLAAAAQAASAAQSADTAPAAGEESADSVPEEKKPETAAPKKKTASSAASKTAKASAAKTADGSGADKPKAEPREKIIDDAEAEAVGEEKPKRRRTTKTAKTAAERARNTIKKETEREESNKVEVLGSGNNNERILELSREGKSNVEIAKTLGLGIGEVKLVVDLYKGGR
ncbi:MAG: DUF6115 domain-containing protein [Butyrivibrio sp.]|nr:DUF6115 domain-containing protein [Butyrivibrio sp.]